METSFITKTEIEKMVERNSGYKDIKPVVISDSEQKTMDDTKLFEYASKIGNKKDTFTLTDSFDEVKIVEDSTSLIADMVIFKEGEKYTRVTGEIKKTGKSYIITKNDKSIVVGVGNSVLFTIVN
jgi:hypothetical protein